MALKISEGGSYTPAPAGLHDAVCISVVDLGMQSGPYGVKQKLLLQWELPTVLTDDGKPHVISRTFGANLHRQGSLRPILASWRGRDFTPEELKQFDVVALLGKPVKLLIQHSTSPEGRVYANVSATIKPDAGQLVQTQTPKLHYDMDAPDDAVKCQFPEWIRKLIDSAVRTEKPAPAASTAAPAFDDDLTF